METDNTPTRRGFLGQAVALSASAGAATLGVRILTPHERIDSAIEEIERALAELYPDTTIQRRGEMRKARGTIIIGAHPDPETRIRYFYDDGLPLFADPST
ncbi:hypothetical protein ACO2RV_17230 [Ancylobacter sp. VNQ12]|uniref:hypothetical protein n=1 Tax=Ancylobacter sp. VNQ12 TaxID=3400920 RepID=UPI003C12A9EC